MADAPTTNESFTPDVGVILLAAGSGSRIGGRQLKQFRWVAGKPVLLHGLQLFQSRPDVGMVVCVLPRSHAGDPPPWIFQSDHDRLGVTVGGRTRGDSVIAGLEELPDEIRVVLVHDAARPLVTMDVVDRVVHAARTGTGAVAALPVVDTLKEVDEDGRIVGTVPRANLWRAQTPQGFPREMIDQAYLTARREGIDATDDSALCERLGYPVVVVHGSERSLKLTVEGDFARAEALSALTD